MVATNSANLFAPSAQVQIDYASQAEVDAGAEAAKAIAPDTLQARMLSRAYADNAARDADTANIPIASLVNAGTDGWSQKQADGSFSAISVPVTVPPENLTIRNAAPVAADGEDGDFWVDSSTARWPVYGPKAGGAWPAHDGTSFVFEASAFEHSLATLTDPANTDHATVGEVSGVTFLAAHRQEILEERLVQDIADGGVLAVLDADGQSIDGYKKTATDKVGVAYTLTTASNADWPLHQPMFYKAAGDTADTVNPGTGIQLHDAAGNAVASLPIPPWTFLSLVKTADGVVEQLGNMPEPAAPGVVGEVASDRIGAPEMRSPLDENGASITNDAFVGMGLLPLDPGYTALGAATANPKFANMWPSLVSGNDLVIPADMDGIVWRNIKGTLAAAFGAFQDDATAVNGLSGTYIEPSARVSTNVNSGSGNTVRNRTTQPLALTSSDPETRMRNYGVVFCLVLDSYATRLFVDTSIAPVVNDLTTGGATSALSAEQGVALEGAKANNLLTTLTPGGLNPRFLGGIQAAAIPAIPFATLTDGIAFSSEDELWVWHANLTVGMVANFTTMEPLDKPNAGVDPGFWVRQGGGSGSWVDKATGESPDLFQTSYYEAADTMGAAPALTAGQWYGTVQPDADGNHLLARYYHDGTATQVVQYTAPRTDAASVWMANTPYEADQTFSIRIPATGGPYEDANGNVATLDTLYNASYPTAQTSGAAFDIAEALKMEFSGAVANIPDETRFIDEIGDGGVLSLTNAQGVRVEGWRKAYADRAGVGYTITTADNADWIVNESIAYWNSGNVADVINPGAGITLIDNEGNGATSFEAEIYSLVIITKVSDGIVQQTGTQKPEGLYRGLFDPTILYQNLQLVTHAGALFTANGPVPASATTPDQNEGTLDGTWTRVSNKADAMGNFSGAADTYAELPAVDADGGDLDNGDWAVLRAPDIGTGSAAAPEFPSGGYTWDGAAWVHAFSLDVGGDLTGTYSGLQRVGTPYRPTTPIDINNTTFNTDIDLSICDYVEFSFRDASGNKRPWPVASLDRPAIVLATDNSGYVWNHDNGFLTFFVEDYTTGQIRIQDSTRGAELVQIQGTAWAENGFVVPTGTVTATPIAVTINAGATTLNGGAASLQILEGVGAYHAMVDLPSGQQLDPASFNGLADATLVDPRNGEITVQRALGGGDLDLTLAFIAAPADGVWASNTTFEVSGGGTFANPEGAVNTAKYLIDGKVMHLFIEVNWTGSSGGNIGSGEHFIDLAQFGVVMDETGMTGLQNVAYGPSILGAMQYHDPSTTARQGWVGRGSAANSITFVFSAGTATNWSVWSSAFGSVTARAQYVAQATIPLV